MSHTISVIMTERLTPKDPNEPKYRMLVKKREEVGF